MQEIRKAPSLLRPTADTLFHLDFDWWKSNDSNWRVFLIEFLCADHQEYFRNHPEANLIDTIDDKTAEVSQVDGLLFELINHCAKQPGFINVNLPLIAKVFRVLLANGNQPISANDLSKIVNKPVATILATLTGPQIFKGIRVFQK